MPRLEEVTLCGTCSPSLWTSPTVTTTGFMIEALSLKRVSFREMTLKRLDPDVQDELEHSGVLEHFPSFRHLKADILAAMFRHSPSLGRLDVRKTNASGPMLVSALASAGPALTNLRLGDCADEALIDRLHILVPNLSYLDVRRGLSPYADGTKGTMLPGLARLASRLRSSTSAQLTRWLSVWKLVLVAGKCLCSRAGER